jgi:hypothetical protein
MLLSDIWGQERVRRSEPRLRCLIGRSCAPWSRRLGSLAFTLRITTNLLRFPSLEQYVLGYLAATPIAARVASMGDQGRSAIVRDVAESLQAYIDDDGLAAPVENHIVVAQT